MSSIIKRQSFLKLTHCGKLVKLDLSKSFTAQDLYPEFINQDYTNPENFYPERSYPEFILYGNLFIVISK